ncbi:MAG: hypothetical protein ACTHLH_11315, partial [Solirubrobacterales bacterium]
GAAFGATGSATSGGGFTAKLLEGFFSLPQLIAKLPDRPLKGVAGLIKEIAGGHLVPFHPSFRKTLVRSLPESHTL